MSGAHRMVHRTIRSAGDRPVSRPWTETGVIQLRPDHPVSVLVRPVSRLWTETGDIASPTGPSGPRLWSIRSPVSGRRPELFSAHRSTRSADRTVRSDTGPSGVPCASTFNLSGVHRMIRCARCFRPTGTAAALGIYCHAYSFKPNHGNRD